MTQLVYEGLCADMKIGSFKEPQKCPKCATRSTKKGIIMNGRYEFHESDWKLFSKKIIDWQENHRAMELDIKVGRKNER